MEKYIFKIRQFVHINDSKHVRNVYRYKASVCINDCNDLAFVPIVPHVF